MLAAVLAAMLAEPTADIPRLNVNMHRDAEKFGLLTSSCNAKFRMLIIP